MTFTGQVPDGTVHMQLMDAMANASDHEPFGIVLLEAMALGVPVVAVAAGGPAEIVEDGVLGLLVPRAGGEEFADAFERVVTSDDVRNSLVRPDDAPSRSALRRNGWLSNSPPRSNVSTPRQLARRLPPDAPQAPDPCRLRGVARHGPAAHRRTAPGSAPEELPAAYHERHLHPSNFVTGTQTDRRRASWLGVPTWKLPSDMWVYQELLVETRPELIVETGTQYGGSSLFYASVFDLLGAGEVVTIDIDTSQVHEAVRAHPRVTVIEGSSTDRAVIDPVLERTEGRRTMLILDSDHQEAHVAEELRGERRGLTGVYLVVEDTALGTQYLPGWGGSLAALGGRSPSTPSSGATRAARSSWRP